MALMARRCLARFRDAVCREKFVPWASVLRVGLLCTDLPLNVNADLGYFDNIIPCGIRGKAVTSQNSVLKSKRGRSKRKILNHLTELFACEIKRGS
jgi:lipoate-protein ligase B